MCLLLCAFQSCPDYPLILAANRDELYARPTAEAQFWNDEPSILAGRDLRAGGTWLGITKGGRVAAVTNYYEETVEPLPPKSRGALVYDFLSSKSTPEEYAEQILADGRNYQGYTLVFGTVDTLYTCANKAHNCVRITPGIHGLGNRMFDEDSFKVMKGREALQCLLSRSSCVSSDDLFAILRDRTPSPAREAASEGLVVKEEEKYSSCFVVGNEFGTRCSTVIMVHRTGKVQFSERTFSSRGAPVKTVQYEFFITSSSHLIE